MKNTIAYKLVIIATSLVMAYFASGIATIAQANELLKADPVKQINLIQAAKDNLALSFTTLTINFDGSQEAASNMIAKQKVAANKNQKISLSKATLNAE